VTAGHAGRPRDRHATPAPDWRTARTRAHAAASALPPETVALQVAAGRRLAEPVVAFDDVPHYASSAMDGWAVAGAGPWRLTGGVAPGPGEALPIVTGGHVPAGADRVLRSEDGRVHDGELVDDGPPPPRPLHHVRPAGEEAHAGDELIALGTVLTPVHLAVAAGAGRDDVRVNAVPRVALLLTGDEVVETGRPPAGRVRDSFGPMLPAALRSVGARVVSSHRVPDRRERMRTALAATDADLVLTTGGTGDSDVDHLRATLEELGAELVVDGVDVRPGRPSMLARLPDGRLVAALPGNPLAAMMGFLLLAYPVLAALAGDGLPPTTSVSAAREVPGPEGRTALVPYRLVDGLAEPSRWRGAGMLRGLADADGVLVRPGDGAPAGRTLDALPLPWR